MQLLLDEDYAQLDSMGIEYEEKVDRRFLVLKSISLPAGIYTDTHADVLVIIPPDYPQGGIDMFWTCPRLRRMDGAQIPQSSDSGAGENHHVDGREFHRWSRHWFSDMESAWRPNVDDVSTIVKRIIWALKKPPLP